MTKMLSAPRSIHGAPLPIPSLDFPEGLRTAVAAAAASSVDLPEAGSYLITVTTPCFVAQDGDAGDAAGSIVLAAGAPFFVQLRSGPLSFRSLSADGAAFIVPLG